MVHQQMPVLYPTLSMLGPLPQHLVQLLTQSPVDWACPGLVDGLTLSVTSCPVELEYPLGELWETGGARFPRDLWTRSWRPQARQLP